MDKKARESEGLEFRCTESELKRLAYHYLDRFFAFRGMLVDGHYSSTEIDGGLYTWDRFNEIAQAISPGKPLEEFKRYIQAGWGHLSGERWDAEHDDDGSPVLVYYSGDYEGPDYLIYSIPQWHTDAYSVAEVAEGLSGADWKICQGIVYRLPSACHQESVPICTIDFRSSGDNTYTPDDGTARLLYEEGCFRCSHSQIRPIPF